MMNSKRIIGCIVYSLVIALVFFVISTSAIAQSGAQVTAIAKSDSAAAKSAAKTDSAAPSLPKSPPVTLAGPQCNDGNTINADMAVLDQPFMVNRLGAAMPQGMTFALLSDIVPNSGGTSLQPGKVMLRPDKRPRPIVLRANKGQCLRINLYNLLSATPNLEQPVTRSVSLHVNGMSVVDGVQSDGSNVGVNSSSLVPPPTAASPTQVNMKSYLLSADEVGTFLLYSMAAPFGSFASGDDGQILDGLFGAVNIQPATAEYYRSQVTNADLAIASSSNNPRVIDYTKRFNTATQPFDPQHPNTSCGAPVLKMVDVQRIVYTNNGTSITGACSTTTKLQTYHTDLNALITGPGAGSFAPDPNNPVFAPVYASPNRTDPWREFTIIYHELPNAVQAFKNFYPPPKTTLSTSMTATSTTPIKVATVAGFPTDGVLNIQSEYVEYKGIDTTQNLVGVTGLTRGVGGSTAASHNSGSPASVWPDLSNVLVAGQDNFAINYGAAGIGAEVFANRVKVGPMANCLECKFEEFFLSSWGIGDPAQVVDVPAGSPTYAQINPNANSGSLPFNSQYLNNMENLAYKNNTPLPPTPANPGTKPPTPANPNNDPNICSVTSGGPPQPCLKAKVAFYPDDPSNVYHSYLNEHVKFQILNAGGAITHVHHQHAHQWLHTPNNTNSSYLDSQMISPGAAFTLEMVYGGSGNRNKTAGDSIFHCHFYPHFAAGMWALWRVHDVFEEGTKFAADGITPLAGINRVLPDGEIALGTPIPAIVPIPTLPMAPMPARVQICPVYNDWKIANYVGDSCVTGTGSPVGFAAVVSSADVGASINPGYPFFIPGIAGHRAPHPPFDFAYQTVNYQKVFYDGGLPRHLILNGKITNERHNQWDFSKDFYDHRKPQDANNGSLNAFQLPENGTQVEQIAMAFMGNRLHPTSMPKGQSCASGGCNFLTNGLPRKPSAGFQAENQFGSQLGAPYADPGVVNDPTDPTKVVPVGNTLRRYKVAVVQTDVAFNKAGNHYPQQRFEVLWNDVMHTMANQKTPEPLFFRANSFEDTIEFWHTNLVPDYYELDDLQVRTPTDILGQHIHLVKFDVLASDGAGNGYNYEDGTLSPDDVSNRILAINNTQAGGTWAPCAGCPPLASKALPPPSDICPPGSTCPPAWNGAQTTVQRWYPDTLEGCPNASEGCAGQENADRTMRTVFTHDHFGPSTHQQIGLYSGLLIEPRGSIWRDAQNGDKMGDRVDGGPTSWQAVIETSDKDQSYREFALEFQDLAFAYQNNSIGAAKPYPDAPPVYITNFTPKWGWIDSGKLVGIKPPCLSGTCLGNGQANPQLVSSNQGIGYATVNYRNEPLDLPGNMGRISVATGNTNPYAIPQAADTSFAFSSIPRTGVWNTQPAIGSRISTNDSNKFVYPGYFTGASAYDPYTPLLRAYQNDRVQIRLLVGAHLFQHSFGLHGLKWLFEPSASTSGWRDNHAMGISEHFELLFTVPYSNSAVMSNYFAAPFDPDGGKNPQIPPGASFADYLYLPGQGTKDIGNTTNTSNTSSGLWGMLRAYNTGGQAQNVLPNLYALPNNLPTNVLPPPAICPAGANVRVYNVAAVNTQNNAAIQLTYNGRNATGAATPNVVNKTALIYVPADVNGNPVGPIPPTDPLILRAAAGECIQVNLFNKFILQNPGVVAPFNATGGLANPSPNVGLHPQLVTFDVSESNGTNVGFNKVQVAPACASGATGCTPKYTYNWYAGNITTDATGNVTYKPIEFGSANLLASDPINHPMWSLIGSLVIEPPGAKWCATDGVNCSDNNKFVGNSTVDVTYDGTNKFREFVGMYQNNLKTGSPSINYGSEPMGTRFTNTTWSSLDLSTAFSNSNLFAQQGTPAPNAQCVGDPWTPIFSAQAGQPVRFRMLHPDGKGGFPDSIWTIHGHVWQEEPYIDGCADATTNCPNAKFIASQRLGPNKLSQWMGSRDGFGPGNHFDILIDQAGGSSSQPGDYLIRSYPSQNEFLNGGWTLFRVLPAGQNLPTNCTPINVASVDAARRRARTMLAAPRRAPASTPRAQGTVKGVDPSKRFFPPDEVPQQNK